MKRQLIALTDAVVEGDPHGVRDPVVEDDAGQLGLDLLDLVVVEEAGVRAGAGGGAATLLAGVAVVIVMVVAPAAYSTVTSFIVSFFVRIR